MKYLFIILCSIILKFTVPVYLTNLIKGIHVARLHLLKESQASRWSKALVLPSK